ncbi:hypothetical protein [Nocardia sp. NPDC058666]|uniref:hypothetical protein n=1 Tax=Nocardia sp. NPDC058666 TaxID=3346587 RepID=UPI00364C4515
MDDSAGPRPAANRDGDFSASERTFLSVSAAASMVFVLVGVVVYRDRAGAAVILGAQVVLWITLVAVLASGIGLMAFGSIPAIGWLMAVGVGFEFTTTLTDPPRLDQFRRPGNPIH